MRDDFVVSDSELESGEMKKNDGHPNTGVNSKKDEFTPRPCYLISDWCTSGDLNPMVTVAVQLPSGTDTNDIIAKVSDDGLSLLLTLTWSSVLCDMSVLHKKFMNKDFPLCHPKVVGFENCLKQLRSRVNKPVVTTTEIKLPKKVIPQLCEQHFLYYRQEEVKILYINLTGVAEQYGHTNKRMRFELL